MRRVRVSRYGNATGLAVYQYGLWNSARLILHVDILPKFWAKERTTWLVDLDEFSPIGLDGCLGVRVTCFEGDALEFKSSRASEVERLVNAMVSTPFQNAEGDFFGEPADAGFFSRDPNSQQSATELASTQTSAPDIFWKLVSKVNKSDELVTFPEAVHVDPTTQASYLASRSAFATSAVRQFLLRYFASSAENLASRRKPLFELKTEDIGAVKGRITRRGLIAANRGLVNQVNCEFEDLVNDSPWYALVVQASYLAKAQIEGDVDLFWAGKLDWVARKLKPQVSSRGLYLRVLKGGNTPSKLRMFKPVFEMARQILLDDRGASLGNLTSGRPVPVATLRVRTAALFEKLLDGRLLPGIGVLRLNHPNTYKLRALDNKPKLPDLAIYSSSGNLKALVDAKYKMAPPSFPTMPMPDQYQQFAYASLSGLPTYFVYVGDFACLEDRILSLNAVATHSVGIWAIPFPIDDNLVTWWEQVVSELQNRGAFATLQMM